MSGLLVALFKHLQSGWLDIAEDPGGHGIEQYLGEGLLVGSPLHVVQLVVAVRVVPEDVTAGLQQHEVELVGEAGLGDGQDHSLLADLLLFLGADLLAGLSVLSVVVRAEVEALDQEVATILLGCAEVVASEDQRGVFDLEDLDL